MTAYARELAQAQRQIAASGQTVTWQQRDHAAPADANKAWITGASTVTTYSAVIAFFPESGAANATLKQMPQSEVASSRLVGIMAAQSFVPKLTDTVLRGGVVYGIDYIDVLAPDGTDLLYTIGFSI